MSLTLITTDDPRVVSAPVVGSLRDALAARGEAVLVVPSFEIALSTQRELAQLGGLALGVRVTTPRGWAGERWEVWGTGEPQTDVATRLALAYKAVHISSDKLREGIPTTKGTVSSLGELARDVLPWLPLAPDGTPDETSDKAVWFTPGRRGMLRLAGVYQRLLRENGLVEGCEVMAWLPERLAAHGVASPPMVVAGFSSAGYAERVLVGQMALQCPVTVVASSDGGPSGALATRFLAELEQDVTRAGFPCERLCETSAVGSPHDELATLRATIFRARELPVVAATGQVRRIEAAGPLAEAELVAREVELLAAQGAHEVAVVAADAGAAWRGLAPRLAARGMRATGASRDGASKSPAAATFLAFASAVARLDRIAREWPEPDQAPDGPIPRLGDMSWWPPRDVTDFLLSEASSVPREKAWALDARWRGNRVLTPAQVLHDLQSADKTSAALAQATSSLLRGRIARAARMLFEGMAERRPEVPGVAWADAESALSDVMQLAQSFRGVGIRLGGEGDEGGEVGGDGIYLVSLEALVEVTSQVLEHVAISQRRSLGPDDAQVTVRICSRGEAAMLGPRSVDALVAMNLTSAEYPLKPDEGAVAAMLSDLGLLAADDPLEKARAQFAAAVAAPRSTLVLERALRDAEAKPTYPAVVLTELMACYGVDPDDDVTESSQLAPLVPRTLSEARATENLSAAGVSQALASVQEAAPTGCVTPASRDLVLVPRNGSLEADRSLSATQIETYLECPYKWFTLRRLGLDSVDADFSGMQEGSFAHCVLERVHAQLFQEAAERTGLAQPGKQLDSMAIDQQFVCGARVNRDNLDRAHALLDEAFDEHATGQLRNSRRVGSQSYVPHTKSEELQLWRLRRDLHAVLEHETGLLAGFEPRYFELRFGFGAGSHHVEYAGVPFVGSVDRVDVNAHGCAVVIDYKHKKAAGFAAEYDVFGSEGCVSLDALEVPRRVQSLIYAQVIRRLFPQLRVVGAVFLSTKGTEPAEHVIAGGVEANLVDVVMGDVSSQRLPRVSVGEDGAFTFEELLDATEELVRAQIASLLAGDIEARPKDETACHWCPVATCERRLASHGA